MRRSIEVEHILKEASDMADSANQKVHTGHILLGMLTNANRSAKLLTDLRVSADRILDALTEVKRKSPKLEEPEALLELVADRMYDAARHTGATLVSSLHLMLALTREKRSVAYRIFNAMGVPPAQVRTLALSRITGPAPRAVAQAVDRRRAFSNEPDRAIAVTEPDREPAPKPALKTAVAEVPQSPSQPAQEEHTGGRTVIEASPSGEASPFALNAEEFPLLTGLGSNLSAMAAEGRLDPVIGRAALIESMIDTLNKRRSNNPCLIGEPGVGKTAVVEGLALAMVERGERVTSLHDKVIISLDVGSLIAGTELRGAFSRRMAQLKEEVRRASGQVIVFIDEIHTLVGAGAGDGALDAANDLKAALARGEFPCIGATTPHEYHRHIERDPALERRFQPLEVPEPSEPDALLILQGIQPHYEAHHGVIYLPETIQDAVRMSRRYIVDRRLPDKAINLIDTAGARAVRHGQETVEPAHVAAVVSDLANIPVERLLMTDAERILGIRDFLGEHVVGHAKVLDTISELIQRNGAGFSSNRPIGSFLFLGPTGVGKTETAKVLADFLFCAKEAMTRFDMSEFMERHAVSRLLGAAPGYIGHEEAGALTAAMTRRPYQIILFDEIEKAHPDVLNILLQILDEGRITDAKGTTLGFSNSVIIMTSNLGAEVLSAQQRRRIGFGDGSDHDAEAENARVLEAARKALLPELWGRIDEKCVFGALERRDIALIARLLVRESSARLAAEVQITYEVDEDVLDYLIDNGGFEPTHGARPMRRAVQRICETAVAQAILRNDATAGDVLLLSVEDGALAVKLAD
jgi:ATP-dependent Clp protease ATP-binding subunit ClpC